MPLGGRPPAPALGRHNVDLSVATVSWEPTMLNLLLTEEDGAAAAAREALRDGNGMLPPAIRDDGAGPERPLQVQLLRGPRWVVVAVADQGPGFTWHPGPPTANESGGWGLFLVDQIADRWGVECTTSGTRVWFEIAYDD